MIDQIQPESVEYFGNIRNYAREFNWALPFKNSFQLKETFHQQIQFKLKEEI